MSDWRAGLAVKIDLRTRELTERCRRLIALTRRTAREIIPEAAAAFARSAARAMPPCSEKSKIGADEQRRPMKDLTDPASWRGPHGAANRVLHFAKKWSFAVCVIPHGRGHAQMRFFPSRTEAEKFRFIPTRGSARYGWLQGLRALGKKVDPPFAGRFPFKSSSGPLMDKNGATVFTGSGDDFGVSVTNHSTAAGEMWLAKSELAGKRLANAALKRQIAAAEKKWKDFF